MENEDVVGAAPTGDAPTTSEWSTIKLPTKVHLILETWRYIRVFTHKELSYLTLLGVFFVRILEENDRIIMLLLCTIDSWYITNYMWYDSAHSTTMTMIKVRSDLHSRMTPHTLHLLARYGMTFVSYIKGIDCNILRSHCIDIYLMSARILNFFALIIIEILSSDRDVHMWNEILYFYG